MLLWSCISINYIDRAILAATAPYMKEDFHLTSAELGMVLSAFFFTYTLFQIPQGWFADKVGQRISLALSVAWWSASTILTALFASGLKSMMLLRMTLGIGEAGAYPGCTGVVAKWFPIKERSRAVSVYDSGSTIGAAIAMPVVVAMAIHWGWRTPFILFGALGLLWAIGWWLYYRDPEKHASVNAAELDHIQSGQQREDEAKDDTIPLMKWYELLKYRNVWAMCLGFFTLNYTIYFFLTWFPTYLVEDRGYDMMSMGWAAVVPPLCGLAGSFTGGFLMDKLYANGHSLTFVRKFTLVGGMLIGTCIIGSGVAKSASLSLFLMGISYFGLMMASCAVWSLVSDVAPAGKASVLAGLQNTFSNAGGVVGPIVTGFIVSSTGSFNAALALSGIGVLIGALIYLVVLGKIEPIRAGNTKMCTTAKQLSVN